MERQEAIIEHCRRVECRMFFAPALIYIPWQAIIMMPRQNIIARDIQNTQHSLGL